MADDAGNTIKVRVAFTDRGGYSESLTSAATEAVSFAVQQQVANSPATGAPSVTGTAQVGETLTADTSGIADADGLTKVSYSFQWLANDGTTDTDITNATDSTYTLAAAEEGKAIKVTVSFTDDAGNETVLTSSATATVEAAPNTPATGAPTITGTAQVGETLTADTSGISDADGLTKVSNRYQWVANDGTADTDITDATDSTFTLVAAYEGMTIKVRVSFTDDAANEESLTSAATGAVAEGPPSHITVVVTEDRSDPNNIVTNFTVTWRDSDGCSTNYNAYLNINPGPEPGHETGSQLHLGSAPSDGAQITKGLTGVHGSWEGFNVELYCGTDESGQLVSKIDIPGISRPRPSTYSSAPLTALTIGSGALSPDFDRGIYRYTAEVPSDVELITLDPVVLTGFQTDIVKDPSGYVVQSCSISASVCTDWSYGDGTTSGIVLSDADTNTLGFQVNLDRGENRLLISVNKGPVRSNPPRMYDLTVTVQNSPATGAPAISGTAQVGETLTADTSGISDADGLDNVAYSYQWLSSRDMEISGATNDSYALVSGDEGKYIKVRVTFTDDAGYKETLTSAATGAVAERPNSPTTGAPTITGTAQVGETLTADTAGIADADGLTAVSYGYQWVANDGTTDTDIPDATDAAYTLVADDEGKTIKVRVTFTDDDGTDETLTSAATAAVIGAAPAQVNSGPPSYITVRVTEDRSDPNDIVTNFTVTWSDSDDCSTDYNAYLNVDYFLQYQQHHLGSAGSGIIQITKGLTGAEGFFDVELYCGTDESGRLVSRVDISSSYSRPKPGTYSTEPPLSALGVSNGTLDPAFKSYTYDYTVPDVANDVTRITITATPKAGYTVDFFEGSGDGVFALSAENFWDGGDLWDSGDCNRSYSDRYGPLVELTDADINTAGFQVDLYDGENHIHVRVLPTNNCDLGQGYSLAITRAEGSVSVVRPNRSPVGLLFIGPSYIGGPCVGCTIKVYDFDISDRDGWDTSTFSYQWLADDAEITGATGSSYTVTDAELGKTLKVRVTFTDDRGTEESVTSDATKVVKLPNEDPRGKPVILGTLEVGQTLTADVSGISDANGLTNATFSYRWANFHGPEKDGEEYTLVDHDEGNCGCWLIVTYTDDAGHEERVSSEYIGVVAPSSNSPATGVPTITGTAQVGETLTADTADIADADGLTNVSYSYQWIRNDGTLDTDIAGATDSTYTLMAADEGKSIKAKVSFTDDAGFDESLISKATEAVAADSNSGPAIKGVAQVGKTLTADTSDIVNGLLRTTFNYQWIANDGTSDTDIVGATDSTYTLVAADEGKRIKVKVSFTNEQGKQELLTSNETATVVARANSPATGAPAISGTVQVGETLTADTSGVADADGLSGATFSYQWVSNDGTSDTDIAGATDSTYTLVAADEGKTIKVRLSFTDDADNDEALTSAATAAIIGAAPVQVNSGPPSYITVWVTENTSDPNNIVTNFTVTWNDSDDCSTDYNAYLNGDYFLQLSQHHLGSAGSGSTQITKGLTGAEGFFDVELYCGTDESGRLVSRVVLSSLASRPKPGTYSSEPPLSALGVSHGALDPAFKSYTYDYTVPDVANDVTRTTITATPKAGYTVDFFEGSGDGVFAIVVDDLHSVGDCTPGLSDRSGPLFELTDADINTAGFQVDLYDGENHVHVRVHSTNNCDFGEGYSLAITRAEGSVSVVRPNRPPVGLPHIGPSYLRGPCVGCTVEAGVSQITDRNGMDNATFGYQWLADDAEITGATGSSYTVTDAELSKTLKVRVTFTDDRGTEESVTSDATKVVKLPNEDPRGKPVILGTLEVGQTLTADVSGISDANGLTNATFSYVWVNFHGPVKDSEEYTLVGRDEGNCGCWLIVTYTDDDGYHEQVESEVIGVVAPRANTPATGQPTIAGTAQVGETLTADTTGITDADGLDNATFSYQWVANDGSSDTDITDATDSTYTVAEDEEGNTIKVKVTVTDDAGNETTLTTAATDVVDAAPQPNSPATGTPAIAGTAQVGETLTADTSGIADANGLTNVAYSYKWLLLENNSIRAEVVGTGSTYTVAAGDVGRAILLEVTFTDDLGYYEEGQSAATAKVVANPNIPATGAPSITGIAQVGDTLTADTSGIADADGLVNVSYSYQWLADDADIAGATASTYSLVTADEGKTIKVRVSFADDLGNAETVTSAATAAVEAPEPPAMPTGLSPSVSNDAVTLTWDDPQDDSITGYIILRRDRAIHPVGTFVTITGDTGSADTTYTDDTVEPDKRYVYRIKAINEHGELSEMSDWVRANTPATPAVPVPDKPTGLSAAVSHDAVTLTWDDPQDDSITGYVILRRDRAIHPVGTFVTLTDDTGSADTTYTDDTVEPDKEYVYRIQAINEHGEVSERSDWVRGFTPAAPAPAG